MIKLGIIFGGKSYEHEISIITAYQLKKKLEAKYEIHLIYVSLNGDFYNADKMTINDYKYDNFKKLKKLNLAKWKLSAIVGAMHGENGEDGLQAAFAKINHIKFVGSDFFSASLAIDKLKTHRYLGKNGVKMVEYLSFTYDDYLKGKKKITIFPCIIKPVSLGSSIGITVCLNKDDLEEKLIESFKYSEKLLIEPYYDDLEEYNLALNETTFSRLEKIRKKDEIFTFENKYSDSFKVMHQSLVANDRYEEFCKIAKKVYELLDAKGIIRIDFFIIDNKIYVNEVNTTPGALSMYLFDDFLATFDESLKRVLSEEEKLYPNNHFMLKNNINK